MVPVGRLVVFWYGAPFFSEVFFLTCLFFVFGLVHGLVIAYWQSLFLAIEHPHHSTPNYNGYVMAVAYLAAALFALIPARIERHVTRIAPVLLGLFPLVNGTLLVLLSFVTQQWVAYVLFVLYHCLFEFMGPIVNVQIAQNMPNIRYGLIFSINSLANILVQTVIQLLVGKKLLQLDIRRQFFFFGCCLFALTLLYIFLSLIARLTRNNKDNNKKHSETNRIEEVSEKQPLLLPPQQQQKHSPT